MSPRFAARPPWLGPDLQTVRNLLRPPRPRLERFAAERLQLAMADGSGDRLVATLQQPAQRRGPLVVVIHGLSGSEDSPYMQVTAAALLERGHPVLRLNLRGAGPSRPLCRRQYHAGRTADLRDAILALDPTLAVDGLLLVGYSLGGNLLLKFLAEQGTALPIRAAASVSAPSDRAPGRAAAPHSCARNRVYHWNCAGDEGRGGRASRRAGAVGAGAGDDQARTIVEFDDRFVASQRLRRRRRLLRAARPDRCSPHRVPTLVVHGADDPWIGRLSPRPLVRQRHLHRALSPGGGHVGFPRAASACRGTTASSKFFAQPGG
ncbi:MAG: alpha/beta fold hydrolase [Candidatus Binatia bacterium]